MEILADCRDESRDSRILCEEHGRRITFINPERKLVLKIQVDDCQIKEGLRCDCLVTYGNFENFVELKGHDLRHAFKQIMRTIQLLGRDSMLRHSYVITSRSPLSAPEIQNFRLKFKKNYRSDLTVKNNSFEVRI